MMRRARQCGQHDAPRNVHDAAHASPCHALRRWATQAGNLRRHLQRRQKPLRRFFLLFVLLCLIMFVVAAIAVLHYRSIDRAYAMPTSHSQLNKDAPRQRIEALSSVSGADRLYIERPDTQHDGGVVRIIFVMSKNNLDSTFCHAIASAFMSDIPLVIAGYAEPYHNSRKIDFALAAAEDVGLREHDIVLVLDSDVMFTGQDMLPYIDKFIAQSPSSMDTLDAKAVREGRAMAPSVYSTETNCYCPQQFQCNVVSCARVYAAMLTTVQYNARMNSTTTTTISNDAASHFVDAKVAEEEDRYVNTGTSIHRVWSLRWLNASMEAYRQANPPECRSVWKDDQTVIHALYIELRYWELAQGALRSHTVKPISTTISSNGVSVRKAKNSDAQPPHQLTNAFNATANSNNNTCRYSKCKNGTVFGLLAGQIGLDVRNELAAVVPDGLAEAYILSSELWEKGPPQTLSDIYSDEVFDYVDTVYNRNKNRVSFTTRRFVHSVTGKSLALQISPQFLVRRKRRQSARLIVPPIVHYAGPRKYRTRSALLAHLPWSLMLRHNATQLQAVRDYLMPIPLHTFGYRRQYNFTFAFGCNSSRFWHVGDRLSIETKQVEMNGKWYDAKDH